jgi:hypothetical protein
MANIVGLTGLAVPNGSGPHIVELVGDLQVLITTGTATANTELRVGAQIIDDLSNIIALTSRSQIVVTATTVSVLLTLPLKGLVSAPSGTRTYRVQAYFFAGSGTIGTASALAYFSSGAKTLRASNR